MKTMDNARIQVENQKKICYNENRTKPNKGENMTLIATQVKRRRGTTAENDAFTGAEGEITVDLGNKELRVHAGDNKVGGYGVARKDFKNLTDEAKNIGNWSSNVSNCITEIPQDIKLELNNGTLTLKAGSKVYVPNGAGVFDVVNITSDLIISGWNNAAQGMLSIKPSTSGIWVALMNQQYSGSTMPTSSQYALWYDTNNNKIKTSSNTGSTWTDGYSLPLALITSNGSSWKSIDQIFNGFGYIGSTVFALPGVKGLIPNGRNADGSLKNTESVTTRVITSTAASRTPSWVILKNDSISIWEETDFYYDAESNYIRQTFNNKDIALLFAGKVFLDSNYKITSFNSKQVFHALDYNDTEYIAHQAMPSNKYINLTLGASGTTYTAPADGYIVLIKEATSVGQYIETWSGGSISDQSRAGANGQYLYNYIPVSKGVSYGVNYNADGSTIRFRFVYAKGAQ